jgi:hypothetical protein
MWAIVDTSEAESIFLNILTELFGAFLLGLIAATVFDRILRSERRRLLKPGIVDEFNRFFINSRNWIERARMGVASADGPKSLLTVAEGSDLTKAAIQMLRAHIEVFPEVQGAIDEFERARSALLSSVEPYWAEHKRLELALPFFTLGIKKALDVCWSETPEPFRSDLSYLVVGAEPGTVGEPLGTGPGNDRAHPQSDMARE